VPFVTVGKVSDVAEGQVRVVQADGRSLALANLAGSFHAIDNVCTHDGGPLGEGYLWGEDVECPRHGARFDVKTGAVRTLPAVQSVRSYPVQVEGDEVRVDVG
jgi:3-phenylpropionate/trans-cinnamate dioxygenase ferredoxin component